MSDTQSQEDLFSVGLAHSKDAPPMTEAEYKIYQFLLGCKGHQNARTAAYIAGAIGLDAETVRRTMTDLILRHGILVGSSPGRPPGFYLIQSQKEIEENYASLCRRAVQIFIRAKILRRLTPSEFLRQIEIDFKRFLEEQESV